MKTYTIQQCILTKNDCYKDHKAMKPKGIVVHSTAARGAKAKHFLVGWNKSGVRKCVHAFLDADGIYQTLPTNIKGWHCGGAFNNDHLSFEICEPYVYTDKKFTLAMYDKATWLCATWCKQYSIPVNKITVLGHFEAHALGKASNHADPSHWFPKCGITMDMFRAEVQKKLNELNGITTPDIVTPDIPEFKRILKLNTVYMHGNDVITLQNRLKKLGFDCGASDGVFGKKTYGAVRAFQIKNKLTANGIVNKVVWTKLFS